MQPQLLLRVGRTAGRVSLLRTAVAWASADGPVVVGRGMRLLGARNVTVTGGLLKLGTGQFSFSDTRLPGLVRVHGKLLIAGSASIAPGNRWDIWERSQVTIGEGTYFGTGTLLSASTSIVVGDGCAIAWQCQFLDDDWHQLQYGDEERPRSLGIHLGDRVWVGSRVTFLKGSRVADGSVVAAGSLVTGEFDEPGCLIGGTPARVLARGVTWR